MAFDPDAPGARFFVNDVGQNAWEEVHRGQAGADYGWNLCEGAHDNPSRPSSVDCSAPPYMAPVHEYNHDAGCSSITGAAFVRDNASWPDSYDDSYLFGDYVCGKIFELRPDAAGGFAQTKFVTGLEEGGPVAMAFDPFGGNPGSTTPPTPTGARSEMMLAMGAGMAVLGVALAVLGEPPGYANLLLRYGLMGAFMSAPMVAWMRYRGHSWSDGLEMTVAMLTLMFALVIPVELGVAGYVPGLSEQSLMMLSHVAMIAGMVVLMIYRFERYAHGAHGAARSAPTTSQEEITHEASESRPRRGHNDGSPTPRP